MRYRAKIRSKALPQSKKLFVFSTLLLVFSLLVLVLGVLNTYFAEAYSSTFSAFYRMLLAFLTFLLPFSLAETLVLLIPFTVLILFVRAAVLRFCYRQKGRLKLFGKRAVCVIFILASLFIHTFGICYHRSDTAHDFGLDTSELSDDDVAVTAELLAQIAGAAADAGVRAPTGATEMPYGFHELTRKIADGYAQFLPVLPPVFSVKPVTLSEPWTYTHISGMYMPFTGESNVNVNFPDYVAAFTTAHEMAHQLGRAGEDEANFYAFLACILSEDDYLRYAGSLNALEYLLENMPPVTAVRLLSSMDARLVDELRAYAAFFEKYRESPAAEVAAVANDSYLRAQGEALGTASYSEVTKLIVAFMKQSFPELYAVN